MKDRMMVVEFCFTIGEMSSAFLPVGGEVIGVCVRSDAWRDERGRMWQRPMVVLEVLTFWYYRVSSRVHRQFVVVRSGDEMPALDDGVRFAHVGSGECEGKRFHVFEVVTEGTKGTEGTEKYEGRMGEGTEETEGTGWRTLTDGD